MASTYQNVCACLTPNSQVMTLAGPEFRIFRMMKESFDVLFEIMMIWDGGKEKRERGKAEVKY